MFDILIEVFHRLGAIAFFCLALAPCWAGAQVQSGDEVVRVDTNLVRLNIGVVDSKARPITNLSRSDFTVYEDGIRQSILSFEPTASSFSIVLLLDVSGSTLSFRAQLKQSALRFVEALAPDDRVAVIAFNERHDMITKFTVDREKIAWAIERAEGRGGTNLYDALSYALKQLEGEMRRRKAIVVLTDGLDTEMRNRDRAATASAVTDEEAIAAIKPEASVSLNTVLDSADKKGVTIYPLALPSGDPKRLPIPSIQLTAIYTSARVRLQLLANRTGGRLSEIKRLEDLWKLYPLVAADLRALYSISYQASGARSRDGHWRTIRVDVTPVELIARTRPGYYAR